MSNNNEVNDNVDSESFTRAEKIRAIRAAVGSGRKPEDAEIPVSVRSHEAPPVKPLHLVKKNVPTEERAQAEEPPRAATPKPKKKKKKKSLMRKFRELFPEKGDGVAESIRKVAFLISVAAIIVCGYLVADYYIDLWKNGLRNNEIAELHQTYTPIKKITPIIDDVQFEGEKPEKYYETLTSAQKLLDLNPDYVGFITLPTRDGSPVFELPVVRANDNDKYLHRSFLGTDSRAGTLFMDWRNHFDDVENHHLTVKNSDNVIIYGHNMADDSMFGALEEYYRNINYYDSHPIIYLESRCEVYTYKIFSVFILDVFDQTETKYDCWNKLDFTDEYDFYKFVNEAKRRTIRLNDVDVKYGDQLLTLSTCNSLLGDNGRLIVLARQLRPDEDPYEGTTSKANTNIKWPTMYFRTRTNEYYDPNAPFTPYGAESKEEE